MEYLPVVYVDHVSFALLEYSSGQSDPLIVLLKSGELHSIIIGSCLPTLRPLYLIVFKRPGREIYVAKKSRAQRAKLYDFNSSIKLSSNPNTPHNQNRDLENSEDVYISQQDNEGIRHVVETDEVQLLKLDWTRSREACLLSTTTFNLDVRAE